MKELIIKFINTCKMGTQYFVVLTLLAVPFTLFMLHLLFGKRERVTFTTTQLVRLIKAFKQSVSGKVKDT